MSRNPTKHNPNEITPGSVTHNRRTRTNSRSASIISCLARALLLTPLNSTENHQHYQYQALPGQLRLHRAHDVPAPADAGLATPVAYLLQFVDFALFLVDKERRAARGRISTGLRSHWRRACLARCRHRPPRLPLLVHVRNAAKVLLFEHPTKVSSSVPSACFFASLVSNVRTDSPASRPLETLEQTPKGFLEF